MPSRPRRRTATLLAVAALVPVAAATTVLPAAARPAEEPRAATRTSLLWATVNVCDTQAHPDTVGIRASMPGLGRSSRERMYVRFQVQYRSGVDGRWRTIGAGGDSGWIRLGSARHRARQTGRNFVLGAPAEGQAFRVRGAVSYEWRRGRRVVRRARRVTEPGHPWTRGADPAGFSAATCLIR